MHWTKTILILGGPTVAPTYRICPCARYHNALSDDVEESKMKWCEVKVTIWLGTLPNAGHFSQVWDSNWKPFVHKPTLLRVRPQLPLRSNDHIQNLNYIIYFLYMIHFTNFEKVKMVKIRCVNNRRHSCHVGHQITKKRTAYYHYFSKKTAIVSASGWTKKRLCDPPVLN